MKPTKLLAQESYVKGLEAELEIVNNARRIAYHYNSSDGDALCDVMKLIETELARAKTELTRLQEIHQFVQEAMKGEASGRDTLS